MAKTQNEIMLHLITGYWISHAISVVARLGIPDLLESPQPADTLAVATGADPSSLYRLLRALASAGIFQEHPDKIFSLTDLGKTLKSGVPDSLKGMAMMVEEKWHLRPWEDLLNTLRTGKSAFENVWGMGLFEYLDQHPEARKAFHDSMSSFSRATNQRIADFYDFSQFSSVVDAGGGHGDLVIELLIRNAALRGAIFELPSVAEGAKKLIPPELRPRCDAIAGDFFQGLPANADCYILKNVLHDWNDDSCLTILRNCRKVISESGKLLVIESILSDSAGSDFGKLLDLEMLVITSGGRERTIEEYKNLLVSTHFQFNRAIDLGNGANIIEAVPS